MPINKIKIFDYFYSAKQAAGDYWLNLSGHLFVKVYLVILAVINFFLWLIALYINNNIETEQIALHYNVDFGINLIGPPQKIYVIPALGLVFILVNLLILLIVSKNRERIFAGHVLLACALISNIILLAAIAAIYLINFR